MMIRLTAPSAAAVRYVEHWFEKLERKLAR